jgi:hypothetical protein
MNILSNKAIHLLNTKNLLQMVNATKFQQFVNQAGYEQVTSNPVAITILPSIYFEKYGTLSTVWVKTAIKANLQYVTPYN